MTTMWNLWDGSRLFYGDMFRFSGPVGPDAPKRRRKHSNGILSTLERPAYVMGVAFRNGSYCLLPFQSRWQWNDLVTRMPAERLIPPDVRAAISAFLLRCQKETRPFATTEAMGAMRTIFPDLDISDADLEDAISSEAAVAGFDIDYDSRDGLRKTKREALERWDNEGGAIGRTPPTEVQRRVENDMDGTQRTKAMKDRNQLI